jgi:hypothetical protein
MGRPALILTARFSRQFSAWATLIRLRQEVAATLKKMACRLLFFKSQRRFDQHLEFLNTIVRREGEWAMKRLLIALVLLASITAIATPASAGPFFRRYPTYVAYPTYVYPAYSYYPAYPVTTYSYSYPVYSYGAGYVPYTSYYWGY